jgi:uncharacterized membrane protein
MDSKPAGQGLSKVLERNIRTIVELRLKQAEARDLQDRIADTVTAFAGSMPFVYIHIVWFGAWIVANAGGRGFDPFPYGLLTMVVSLEAIFLSAFVLITQNRQSEEAEKRADLDLQIGLLAEHELTRVLKMLDAIHNRLAIEPDADNELPDLEKDTMPEDVLAELDRIHRATRGHGHLP